MNSLNSKQGLDEWLANPQNRIKKVTREFSESEMEKPRIILRLHGNVGAGGFKVIININPEARHKKQPHKCKCFFHGTCVEGSGCFISGELLVAAEEKGERGGFYLSNSKGGKDFCVRALVDDAIADIVYQYEADFNNEKNHPQATKKLVKGAGFVNVKRQKQVLSAVRARRASQNSSQHPHLTAVK